MCEDRREKAIESCGEIEKKRNCNRRTLLGKPYGKGEGGERERLSAECEGREKREQLVCSGMRKRGGEVQM